MQLRARLLVALALYILAVLFVVREKPLVIANTHKFQNINEAEDFRLAHNEAILHIVAVATTVFELALQISRCVADKMPS